MLHVCLDWPKARRVRAIYQFVPTEKTGVRSPTRRPDVEPDYRQIRLGTECSVLEISGQNPYRNCVRNALSYTGLDEDAFKPCGWGPRMNSLDFESGILRQNQKTCCRRGCPENSAIHFA